jgi:hypothetical protein
VTLIQPQHKGGAFKGPAKDKSVKADIHLTASIGSSRPIADVKHKEKRRPRRTRRCY